MKALLGNLENQVRETNLAIQQLDLRKDADRHTAFYAWRTLQNAVDVTNETVMHLLHVAEKQGDVILDVVYEPGGPADALFERSQPMGDADKDVPPVEQTPEGVDSPSSPATEQADEDKPTTTSVEGVSVRSRSSKKNKKET